MLAREVITAGRVLVGGAPATTPARQVAEYEAIRVSSPPRPYVSRGGAKLAAALDHFAIPVERAHALDAGASTGGFTDCLLQRGAHHVHAVDVGRGQLAWKLRTDPRVTVLERTNVRDLAPDQLGGRVALTVADLSFISLVTVASALAACTTADGDLVLLVKPQFEAARDRVGKGGVVRDRSVHAAVLVEVARGLETARIFVRGVVASPLLGADGNREFLVHCRQTGPSISPALLASAAQAEDG